MSQPKDLRPCLSLSRAGSGSCFPGLTACHVRHFGELLHDVVEPRLSAVQLVGEVVQHPGDTQVLISEWHIPLGFLSSHTHWSKHCWDQRITAWSPESTQGGEKPSEAGPWLWWEVIQSACQTHPHCVFVGEFHGTSAWWAAGTILLCWGGEASSVTCE